MCKIAVRSFLLFSARYHVLSIFPQDCRTHADFWFLVAKLQDEHNDGNVAGLDLTLGEPMDPVVEGINRIELYMLIGLVPAEGDVLVEALDVGGSTSGLFTFVGVEARHEEICEGHEGYDSR